MPTGCKITRLCLLLLALMGFWGCVKEDLSDCRPGIVLAYDYSRNAAGENLFGQEVDKTTVYAFDKDGYYVARYSEAGPHLTNDYLHSVPLPEGKYTLVVWAGPLDDYTVGEMEDTESGTVAPPVEGRTHIDDFMLKLRTDKFGDLEVDQSLCPLWHGKVSEVVSDYTGRNRYTVTLTKDTRRVAVSLTEGAASGNLDRAVSPGARDGEPRYAVELRAGNGRYTSGNSVCEHALELRYTPLGITFPEPRVTRYDFTTLRLMADRSCGSRLLLVDTHTGRELLDRGLVDLIFDNPAFASQDYLDRTEVFNIDLNVDASVEGYPMRITIRINGWQLIEIIPEV
ncbi:MAG: FimB/Mfa2 family fimbrial subunit [Rikenellaceae bacterium]|nr:FimB/Mfa2 family fimbrial subunit [Rikenellaceae bacterium]